MQPHSDRSNDATALADEVRRQATPLREPGDMGPLLDRIGAARVVMLGEASHGTSEYYTWRARITQRLVREKGFSFVAVEGDWPDAYRVNRYVKGYDDVGASAREVLHAFRRWPTWMWANWEAVALAEWLRKHNDAHSDQRGVGFYGLDVYSLWESLAAIVRYLEETDPAALEAARRAYACFEPYGEDAQAYARSTAFVQASCEDEVVELLGDIRRHAEVAGDDEEARFDAEQNARAAVGAERYYRTMVRGGSASWNVRDHHMIATLDDLLEHHGPDAKAIVWEHNTHVGDARATDMAAAGMVNTGQLARERYGDDEVLVGAAATARSASCTIPRWSGTATTCPPTCPPATTRSCTWTSRARSIRCPSRPRRPVRPRPIRGACEPSCASFGSDGKRTFRACLARRPPAA